MKTCLRCHAEKPLSEFSPDVSRRDGKYPYCKPCASQKTLKQYRADPYRFRLRMAVSMFRQFKDDPEFWQLVETMPTRRRASA